MGMYDDIYFSCPDDECDGRAYAQSKAGDCYMTTYTPDDVPKEIAADLDGEFARCSKCCSGWRMRSFIPFNVQLRLEN